MNLEEFKQFGTVRFSGGLPTMGGTGFLVKDSHGICLVTASHVLRNFEPCIVEGRINPSELCLHFKTLEGVDVNLQFDSRRFNEGEFDDFWCGSLSPTPVPDVGNIRIVRIVNGHPAEPSNALIQGLVDQQWIRWPVFERAELVGLAGFEEGKTCYANGYPNPPIVPGHDPNQPSFRTGQLFSILEERSAFGLELHFVLSELLIGPGDSGGPLVIMYGDNAAVVGVLTNKPHNKLSHTLAWPTELIQYPM